MARAREISDCITWITTAEALNTKIRTTGHSAANAFCSLGAVLAYYVVQGGTSFFRIGIIMGLVHVFTVLCVSQMPETKNTKMA